MGLSVQGASASVIIEPWDGKESVVTILPTPLYWTAQREGKGRESLPLVEFWCLETACLKTQAIVFCTIGSGCEQYRCLMLTLASLPKKYQAVSFFWKDLREQLSEGR